MDFAAHLREHGPTSRKILTREQALAYTRELAGSHYENFPVLSVFVPRRLTAHFANVYAYCRWSDDLADEVADGKQAAELLDWWQGELEDCYAGKTRHPVMIALAETIERFSIPIEPFEDLLFAFRQDLVQKRYADFPELLQYCRYSANPVGRLVLYLCERFDEENASQSDAVCTGLQLANFWQDVAIDWQKGRVYIPQDDLARSQVDEAAIAGNIYSPAFADLMRMQVTRAEDFLRAGRPLAQRMPGRLKFVVGAFAEGGLRILERIRAVDFDVLHRRPKLGKKDGVMVLGRAVRNWLVGIGHSPDENPSSPDSESLWRDSSQAAEPLHQG